MAWKAPLWGLLNSVNSRTKAARWVLSIEPWDSITSRSARLMSPSASSWGQPILPARVLVPTPPMTWARYTGRRSRDTARSSCRHSRYFAGSWGGGSPSQSPSGSTPPRYSLRTSSPTSSRKLPPGAVWASRHRARARSQLASSRGTAMALSMVISPHRNQVRPRFSRTSFSKVWGFPFLKSR